MVITSDESLQKALAAPLAGLVHELYFKKPHFAGGGAGFSRREHDQILQRLAGSDWPVPDSNTDPVSALLAEVLILRRGEISPEDTADTLAKWERAESTINARVRAACELCGPVALSESMEAMALDWAPLPPLSVTSMRACLRSEKRADRDFGQPDLLLEGASTLILIEMKVRGGAARAKYTADQFFKYLLLSDQVRRRRCSKPRTLHVLTAPTDEGKVVTRGDVWLTYPVHGSELRIDISGLLQLLAPRRRAQVIERGGESGLQRLVDQMPCRFVDFRHLLDALGSAASPAPALRRELARQLDLCKEFSFGVSNR